MTTLTGKTIQETFKDLLQVSNVNQGIDTTVRAVSDGEGTGSQFFLSTTITRIGATGTLDFAAGGKFDPTNMAAITGTWTDLGTVTTVIFTSATINGGTMDDVVIGATTAVDATFDDSFAVSFTASGFLQASVRTTSPAGIADGAIFLADGTTLDPLARNAGPYYVGRTNSTDVALGLMQRATVQTTDATKTTIVAISVPSGEERTMRVSLSGVEDNANNVTFDLIATARNVAGTTTLISIATGFNNINPVTSTWVVELDIDDASDELRLDVTGDAATTINWVAHFTEM